MTRFFFFFHHDAHEGMIHEPSRWPSASAEVLQDLYSRGMTWHTRGTIKANEAPKRKS